MIQKPIIIWHKHLDYNVLSLWYQAHSQLPPIQEDLPELGYYVELNGIPIASACLRICEGNFGMLDGLITNPTASSEDRSYAIDTLTETIIEEAFMRKIKSILALSYEDNIIKRSKKYGFCQLAHTVILKPLFERY